MVWCYDDYNYKATEAGSEGVSGGCDGWPPETEATIIALPTQLDLV